MTLDGVPGQTEMTLTKKQLLTKSDRRAFIRKTWGPFPTFTPGH